MVRLVEPMIGALLDHCHDRCSKRHSAVRMTDSGKIRGAQGF
jgi:hypothetical protein